MKKVLLFMLMAVLGISINAHSKKKDTVATVVYLEESSGDYVYENVVEVNGKTSLELFNKAKAWIYSNVKTGDNQINADSANLVINTTPELQIDAANGGWAGWNVLEGTAFFNFKLTLQFKEGRYKIRISNINILSKDKIIDGAYSFHYQNTIRSYKDLMAKKDSRLKYFADQVNLKLPTLNETFSNYMQSAKDQNDW